MSIGAHFGRDRLADLMAQALGRQRVERDLGQYRRLAPAGGLSPAALLDYFEVPAGVAFDVSPEKAIEYFTAKGLRPTFSYADMLGEAHDHAFTVAKMMDVDLLGQVQASLESALANGTPFRQWAEDLMPKLQAAGWWGRQAVLDPLTGQTVVAQLGSARRLETVFRTNMQAAYAAQKWLMIESQASVAPYLMYDAVDDHRTRPEHRAWDQKVLPVSSAWWDTHYPPNGYNCRCGVIQLSKEEVDALGLQVSAKPPRIEKRVWVNPRTGKQELIPEGIDPGFDRNVGKHLLDKYHALLAEKVAALPNAALKTKARASIAKLVQEAADAQKAVAQEAANAALLRAQAKAAQKAEEFAKKSAAQGALDAIKSGQATDPGGHLKAALAALTKSGALPVDPVDALDAVKAKAAEAKAKQKLSAAKSAYKKAVLDGKIPTPAVKATVDAMPEADKQAFLDQVAAAVEAKKAKEAAELAAKLAAEKKEAEAAQAAAAQLVPKTGAPKIVSGNPPDPANLTQIGPQRGSNSGGLYLDTTTGTRWYVKTPASAEIARNEVLAARLYELAGVDVPELHLIDMNGRTSIASRIVDGLAKGSPSQLARAGGVAEGFAADAWLANWDVVGLDYDNLLLRGSRAVRVDTGGALRFRAQGGLKGAAFGDEVNEIDSLRSAANRQAASVFGGLTQAQIEASVARVLAIDEADIRAAVELYGPEDAVERAALVSRLLARRRDLARRFPRANEPEAPAPAAGERVTDVEQQLIVDARSNGYGFKTDKGEIEDQMVTVSTYRTDKGASFTRAWLKLRPDAAAKLLAHVRERAIGDIGTLSVDLSAWRDKALEAIRGINSRAARGEAWEEKDTMRLAEAIRLGEQAASGLRAAIARAANADPLQQELARVTAWTDVFIAARGRVKVGIRGDPIPGRFPADEIPASVEYAVARTANVAKDEVSWERKNSLTIEVALVEKGHATLTKKRKTVDGVSETYEAKLPGGGRIRFVPDTARNEAYALRGTVYIDLPGVGASTSARVFDELRALGIDSSRATASDRDNLYLNAFARLKFARMPDVWRAYEALDGGGLDGDQLVKAKLAFIKERIGIDVAASQGWAQRDGVYQAFGHGRAYQLRPDLYDADFRRFESEGYLVYRNFLGLDIDGSRYEGTWDQLKPIINAGGQVLSQVERMRVGTFTGTGTSVKSDLKTGGASYVFTRIKSANRFNGAGVYWRPTVLRRLDAISYDGDRFGAVKPGSEAERMGQAVDDFRRVERRNTNETIFKNGLSLFDDVEKIVLGTRAERDRAIADMRAMGYDQWPDGRRLEDVFKVAG